jgi:rifampicin phosphotransferase
MFLFPLTDILFEQNFGGKASGLSKINSFGLNVPEGFAIHKEAYKYYVLNKQFPPGLKEELNEKLSALEGASLIVRSSAIGEDADDFSFAGQLDSFVVENNIQAVIKGITKCWDSIHNSRAAAYQKISGNRLCEMGVVIQQFVEADYSGVLFTQSPKNENHTYVEYVKGGAEPLVSGKVTPFSFSVNGNLELIVHSVLPFDHKILVNSAMHLKENFKKHLDIEWIYADGKFHFVQARPIKIIDKEKVYWTNTNLNENYPTPISPLLYSIARDSYYHYFKNLAKILQLGKESIRKLEYDFSNSVGVFGNRIYYNMTSIHNILAASPYKSYFQDAFNKFVGYKIDDASSKNFSKKQSIFQLGLRLLFLNISLGSHVKKIEAKVTEYDKKVTDSNGIIDLSLCFYEFLDLRFYQWYHASLADLFSMIHYKLLGSFTKRIYGADYVGVHNGLIQAIPDLISNEPLYASWEILKEIEKIPDGKNFFISSNSELALTHISKATAWKAVDDLVKNYLKNWGFRCSGELMFTTENYIDSPQKFIELLQLYFKYGQDDPKISISKMDAERRKIMRTSVKMIFRKRHILFPLAIVESFTLILLSKLCRNAILSRERVRYKQAQMYYNFKKVVFRIGAVFKNKGLIKSQEDILFFDYKEIGSLLASSNMFTDKYAGIISIRKENYEAESEKKFPESFDTTFGERPKIVEDFRVNAKEGNWFKGLAASGGKIRARVKVLKSVMEADKIKTGEILVAKQTDPGWAMVFPIIGGLIAERGGALSHGAIVAREFGIPAVLGIENITEILKDNDEIILDGDLGKIQLL